MRPIRLTLALGIAAIGAGWLLVPGTAERLSMLARDGQFLTAMREGDDAIGSGTEDAQVLARLFDINSHEGDPTKAREAILLYLGQRPDDIAMLWRAVEFLEEGEDLEGLQAVLSDLVERTADPAAIEKLARLYRLYGQFDKERALLVENTERLPPAMAWRAAGLLAREGDFERAASLVRRLDDEADGLDAEQRTLAFDVLVRSGAAPGAGERASRWMASGMPAGEQALYVLNLAMAGANDAALALATTAGRDAADPDGLAWMLGTRGHVEIAEAIIDRWTADAPPALRRKATRLYVDLAISTGTVGRLLTRADERLRSADPAARQQGAILAATLYERQGYASIAALRPLLTGEILAGEPLFGAALSQAERNLMAARVLLLRSDLSEFGEDEARLWVAMADDILGPAATADVLLARWRAEALSPAMLARLQDAARRGGRFDPAWAAFARPASRLPGAGPDA